MNYQQDLVNIITPTYNCAQYLPRLLESVMMQSYPYVEMIIVDDGSTDNTREVVDSYIQKFKERGYILHYQYKTNGGANSAINMALKWVHSEYLLYPDADDWYKTRDAIETMVNAMKVSGDDVGIVRCRMEFVDENGKVDFITEFNKYNTPCDLLDDVILGTNSFNYAPIQYILDARELDNYIKDREIYTNKLIGQNYQILIPYLANSKCVSIDNILCCYFVRNNSHCHSNRSFEERIIATEAGIECIEYTLSRIDSCNKERKDTLLPKKEGLTSRERMMISYEYSKKKEFRYYYREAKKSCVWINKRSRFLWMWTYLFSIGSFKKMYNISCAINEFLSK